jgi:hypothetical protein
MSGPVCTLTPMLLLRAQVQLVCVAATLQLAVRFLQHMCSIAFFIVKTVTNFDVSV